MGPSTSTEPGRASRISSLWRSHHAFAWCHTSWSSSPCMLLSFERPLSEESPRAHLSAALENCTAATCLIRSNADQAYVSPLHHPMSRGRHTGNSPRWDLYAGPTSE